MKVIETKKSIINEITERKNWLMVSKTKKAVVIAARPFNPFSSNNKLSHWQLIWIFVIAEKNCRGKNTIRPTWINWTCPDQFHNAMGLPICQTWSRQHHSPFVRATINSSTIPLIFNIFLKNCSRFFTWVLTHVDVCNIVHLLTFVLVLQWSSRSLFLCAVKNWMTVKTNNRTIRGQAWSIV